MSSSKQVKQYPTTRTRKAGKIKASDWLKCSWVTCMIVWGILSIGLNRRLAHTNAKSPVHLALENKQPKREILTPDESPICLSHTPMHVNASLQNPLDNPNVTLLEHSQGCGRLRRDWTLNPPRSKLAREMLQHQSNCSLPEATFHVDNLYGLGSHVSLWSQALCLAWHGQARLRTYNPDWLWLDQTHCSLEQAQQSPLLCYFPQAEVLCDDPPDEIRRNISDPRNRKIKCGKIKRSAELRAQFRAASVEYLFRSISPLVIHEAQRQVGIVFGEQVPEDLIAVHIRWGDKFFEMDLCSIDEYIQAVSTLLWDQRNSNATANIYLATEDPRAAAEFRNATPPGWKVYVDPTVDELTHFRPTKGNRASWMAKNTRGRAGLVALGSLLVAMEANYFVLTTQSNWSRLMDQLRTTILDPRCGNCTRMIDLRPKAW